MNRAASAPRAGGFTLIEMVITVAIIALLASISVPLGELVAQRNREQDLRAALREIRRGIDAYKQAVDEGRVVKKVDESGYPPTLKILVEGVTDARDPNKRRIYFLRRIPPDPMAAESAAPPDATWGLRSYESSPEEPEEGADVYDVYSKSAATGLNGISYRQW